MLTEQPIFADIL